MPDTVCEQILQFCDTHSEHFKQIDQEMKQCRQISLNTDTPELSDYIEQLNSMISEYLNYWSPGEHHKIMTVFNIQSYAPGEGFIHWHHERGTTEGNTGDRSLVFMTYLNTVPDGPTHFKHQQLRIEAETGKTIIWPADFTHTHCGEVSDTQQKHIVPGWITCGGSASKPEADVELAAPEDILTKANDFIQENT